MLSPTILKAGKLVVFVQQRPPLSLLPPDRDEKLGEVIEQLSEVEPVKVIMSDDEADSLVSDDEPNSTSSSKTQN